MDLTLDLGKFQRLQYLHRQAFLQTYRVFQRYVDHTAPEYRWS